MRASFRQAAFAATAIIGLSAFAAGAAPLAAGDSTTVPSPAMANSPAQQRTQRGMAGQIEQRITGLHATLQITVAQQPLWDQFAQVMRNNAANMDATFQHRAQTLSGMTAPENMESYAKVAAAHAQDVAKLVPAFQALYTTMTDGQKRLADQAFRDGANHGAPARRG